MKSTDYNKKNSNYIEKNIALVGHMGSGKSVLGKIISKKMNLIHFDSDIEVEKYTGMTINEIFSEYNEDYFRKIEEKVILKISEKKGLVLSLGGGSILSKNTRKSLKKKFVTVFLDVNLDTILERLENSKKRPLLKNTNIRDKIKELDIIRRKYYLLADIKLTSQKEISNTFKEFNTKYKKFYEKTNSH